MANMQDIAILVTKLSAAFPNWKPNEYTVEVYYQDLRDIPTDELEVAAQHCRSQAGRQFAPSTGDLRGAVLELRRMAEGAPTSYQAWEEVRCFIRDNNTFIEPRWSHPLIGKTVRLFGMENLRQSENGTSDRMRFLEAYEQYAESAEREEMLIPEVRGYLEVNGGKLLSPASQIGLLAGKLTVKR